MAVARGPPLVTYLDDLPKIARLLDHPFRMPITDKYKDMGTIVMGKVQSGRVKKGGTVYLFPNKDKVRQVVTNCDNLVNRLAVTHCDKLVSQKQRA